jgi:hypothetical protein
MPLQPSDILPSELQTVTVKPPPQTAEPHPSPVPARGRHFTFRPPEAVVVLGLIVAYLAIMLPSLTRFPPLNNDEGREANLSWVASGLEPGAERMNAYRGFSTWGTGGLQGATTVALFHFFNLGIVQPSLVFQARLTSLLWGGLLLLLVYWLGRQYWGKAVGLVASALLAISDPFLLSTHTLRPDIQVITLVLLALALVEYGMEAGRRWPQLLGGVLLGLSIDTHPNTVGLIPIVLAAPLVRYGSSVWRWPTVWLLAAGFGLAAIYYAAVRVLPDPSGYFTAFRYWIGVDKALPVVRESGGGLLGQLQSEFLRYADYFGISPAGVEEPAELLLVLAGLVFGLWQALRGSRPERILLLGLLATSAFFILAVSTKSRYYMLLTYPIYVLLIARGFERLATKLANIARRGSGGRYSDTPWRRRQVVFGGALAGLVLLAAFWPMKVEDRTWDKYVRGVRYRSGQEYYALTARLEQLAGPDARVLAPPLYWFGLKDHDFTDIFVYERVRRQFGETPAEFLASVRPDFVITDAKIASEQTIERELIRVLDERASRELVVRHKNYGDVIVYHLSW